MGSKELILEAKAVLMQLVDVISILEADEYVRVLPLLSDSTIGAHTRHIIELFEQLLIGYEVGVVDYDHRKRNILLQQNVELANEYIFKLVEDIDKPNKPLLLSSGYSEGAVLESNYDRELMYNVEHCIHHQAIIKIGLLCLEKRNLDESFGVAKATIDYRNACVQ